MTQGAGGTGFPSECLALMEVRKKLGAKVPRKNLRRMVNGLSDGKGESVGSITAVGS